MHTKDNQLPSPGEVLDLVYKPKTDEISTNNPQET